MASEAEKLLQAEQAVQELLNNVGELKREIENYAQASASLSEARDHLSRLTSSIDDLVRKSTQIIETLGRLGTPEILSKVEEVKGVVDSLSIEHKQNFEETFQIVRKLEDKNRLIFSLLIVNLLLTAGAILVGLG